MNKYFYAVNDQKLGPCTIEELKELSIDRNTLVWNIDLKQWKAAKSVEELSILFVNSPPPVPKPLAKVTINYFRISAAICTLSAILAWIRIDTIVVSGPIVMLLSILMIFKLGGQSERLKILCGIPLLICAICTLTIIVTDIKKSEALFPIGTLITIGLVIYLYMIENLLQSPR